MKAHSPSIQWALLNVIDKGNGWPNSYMFHQADVNNNYNNNNNNNNNDTNFILISVKLIFTAETKHRSYLGR